MSKKKQYAKKFEGKLEEIDAEIDRLKAQAKQKDADARLQAEDEIDELKQRREKASARLDELQDASEDAWDDVKSGFELAWQNLENATRSATARFQ